MKHSDTCQVCGRTFFSTEGRFPVGKPVVHHLIPKQKFRRRSGAPKTITICSRCHKQLHTLYNNIILKKNYSNLTKIKNDAEMKKFVQWLRKER